MNDDQSEDNNNNNNNNNMNNNMNNQGNSNQSSNSSMNKNHKNASNTSSNPKANNNNNNNNNNKSEISISYLEPNIMTNSVGAILSSYFGLESWEGWEAHEHEITKIVDRIDTFIEKLSSSAENNAFLDLNNMIVGEDVFRRESQDLPLKSIELEEFDPTFQKNQNIQDSLQELNETLKVLGLSLPNHLMPSDSSPPPPPTNEKGQSNLKSSNPSGNNTSGVQFPNRTHLRRMVIKLPQGQTGELMIDLESNVESQVDLFLETHGMDDDLEARRKLLQSVLKMQREYLEANNSSARVNNFYNNNNNNNSNNNGRASLQQGTPPQRTSSMNYGKRE
jgi:ribosomal protein S10